MIKPSGLLLIIVILLSITFTGCADKRILEDLALIQTIGFDTQGKDNEGLNKIQVTVSIPQLDPKVKKKSEVLTTIARSSKEARVLLNKQSNLQIVNGQLRSALFGKSLAKEGIWKHLDTFVRDPDSGFHVMIIVVNGTAKEVLHKVFTVHPSTPKYIDLMIEKEFKKNKHLPINLHQFVRDLLDDGIDPVAPVIKLSGDHLQVDGIALFQNDRYKAQINKEDIPNFLLLKGKVRGGLIQITLPEGDEKELITLGNIKSKRTISVLSKTPERIKVSIHTTINGSILEYKGKSKTDLPEVQDKLEKVMAAEQKKKFKTITNDLQRNNTDSIGLGQYIRNGMDYNEWKQLNWHQIYPNIDIQHEVEVKIKDIGNFK